MALVVIPLGCRQRGLTSDRSHLSDSARSQGACDFDLTEEHADSVFFVLGVRNTRGMLEGDDLLGSFYCNEQPVAELFHRRVERMAAEQGLTADTRRETAQGCLTTYRSKIMAERLNSCYTETRAVAPSAPNSSTARRPIAMSLNTSLIYRGGVVGVDPNGGMSDNVFFRRRALAYVAGVWARYRHDRDFAFSGDSESAELVASLLNDLGCHNVRVEHTVGFIPGGWFVHFEPTNEVTEWLNRTW